MSKDSTNTNVVAISKTRNDTQSRVGKLRLAQEKVYKAWETSGRKRLALAKEALAISKDCIDAYFLLTEGIKDRQKRIKLYRQAVEAGRHILGSDWETKYRGICWLDYETRPIMCAMASLAIDLQWEDELPEALSLYRKLMELNPNDNQGIRYLFAGCLYEAGCDSELEKLLADYAGDVGAALLYTKALYLFRKPGASDLAIKALVEAFRANANVPIFLSDIVEMPNEAPATIGFGDDREAIAYVMDNGYLWFDTEDATEWMSEVLAPELRKVFEDQELVEEVLKALKGEYDD